MDKKSIFFIILSIMILIVMFYFVGIGKVIEALKSANLYLIGLALVIQIFAYCLYTLRWKILNNVSGINVSFKKLLPIMMVGLAVNNITPSGRGGGEPVRAYILAKQHNYMIKDTFATVIADKALDTFPFVVLAVITIFSMIMYFNIALWLVVVMSIAIGAIVALLIVFLYMCVNEKFGVRVEGWISSLIRKFKKKDPQSIEKRVHDFIVGFQDNIKMLMSSRKTLAYTITLSFIIWFFEILRVYVVFLAFGAGLNLIVIAEVFIVASLVGMIPLLPGGLGAVDGLMALLYSKSGIALSLTAPITLIERLISFWMATIIGLLLIPHYGASVLDKISVGSSADALEKSVENEK